MYFQIEEPIHWQNDPLECTADEYDAFIKIESSENTLHESTETSNRLALNEDESGQEVQNDDVKYECVSLDPKHEKNL